jgi:UDP-N-acetylglucosamine/UDP-N-acetylgalactosamine 4-epimerase
LIVAPLAAGQKDLKYLLSQDNGIWLVTGGAGFIGSNLIEFLIKNGQRVRCLDNFATGYQRSITVLRQGFSAQEAANLEVMEGDIRSQSDCRKAVQGVSHVLHQAGLGSVPRSLRDPLTSNDVNVGGFLNMLEHARLEGVASFVFASSSSTYGDEPNLPKIEDRIGKPLSPYAVTKLVNEIYAQNYVHSYGFKPIGLRYFNLFGPRQDPNGAYAAVIPRWISAMIHRTEISINGDGETSRDFCYVQNAVQANVLAALASEQAKGTVYNVAVGGRTTLNTLFQLLRSELVELGFHYSRAPVYKAFRDGDVRHSQADISKAQELLGYAPAYDLNAGIKEALPWYVAELSKPNHPIEAEAR